MPITLPSRKAALDKKPFRNSAVKVLNADQVEWDSVLQRVVVKKAADGGGGVVDE